MTDSQDKTNGQDVGPEGLPTVDYGSAAIGPGARIGRYKLLRILGEGGYGIVYLAEQQRPVKRRVALKVIKPGMDTKEVIARFEAERQALAFLDHPNIAHVFNAGTTKTGQPYFTMEYVKGIPITEHCDRYKLSIEERLKLFLAVCEAIQHAHQKAIIHRDIKPSNILVAYEGEQAVPMIIDFGVAKALTQSLTTRTLVTEQAQMIGTPEYMSPEQAEMSGQDIDTRTDIYSLGVLLYELLTGTLPFDSQTLREAGYEGMRRMIREQDPKTPSARLGTIERKASQELAQQRKTDLRMLERRLHGELDWITLKAMDKDRTRRYHTAHTFAEDIQRYLNQEPVLAGPPSTVYRLKKLAVRNKGVFVSAASISVVLVLGVIVSTWQAVRATRAERMQTRLRQRAEAGERLARKHLYATDMILAQQAMELSNLGHARRLLEKYRPSNLHSGTPGTQVVDDPRGWEWRYLWHTCRSDELRTLGRHSHIVSGVAFSPDGARLATQSIDGQVNLWDMRTGSELALATAPMPGYWALSLAFTPDGKLATASNRGVETWDITSGLGVDRFPAEPATSLSAFAFAPTGERLAIAHMNGEIRLWDVVRKTADSILANGTQTIPAMAFSPDGSMLATAGGDGRVRLWNVVSGQLLHTLGNHQGGAVQVAFSVDGETLASGGWDEVIQLWDVTTGRAKGPPIVENIGRVDSLVYSPDGKTLAAASADHTIRLWDATTYEEIARLKGHLDEVWKLAFAPDGQTLASVGKDHTVRLWNAVPRIEEATELELALRNGDSVLMPWTASKWLVSVATDGVITLWDAGTLQARVRIETDESKVVQAAVLDNQTMLALGTEDGRLRFWDLLSKREEPGISGLTGYDHLTFSPNGKIVASFGNDGTGRLWDLATRSEAARLDLQTTKVSASAFSPDGETLALAYQERESPDWMMALWDVDSQDWIEELPAHEFWVYQLAFSPDGRRLASASMDGTAKVWNLADPEEPAATLKGPLQVVLSVSFSPDGTRLVTSGDHGLIQMWDMETFQGVAVLEGDEVPFAAFFVNNDTVIAGGWDLGDYSPQTPILWQAASRKEIEAAEEQRGERWPVTRR